MPFSDIFGQFGGGGSCGPASPAATYAIDQEFIELAIELIDETIPTANATWVSIANDEVIDPDDPGDVEPGDDVEHAVRIVFFPPDLQGRRFFLFLKDSELTHGTILGIFYKTHFVPKLKDVVRWNSRSLHPCYIDEITVAKDTIVYIAEFDL